MPTITSFAVKIPKAIIDRRDWVKYLVLVKWHNDKIGDIVKASPTKEFNAFVETTLNDYLSEGKLPASDIAPAIMNLADDHLAGKELVLKAGDYYALQTHFRAMKPVKPIKPAKSVKSAVKK